jgi:heme/copper-type cytochrome/quinol oxidase subunit 4
MENLLGVEMILLIVGIFITVGTVLRIILTVLGIYTVVQNKQSWEWNALMDTVLLTIGIVLIIISQSL